MKERIDNLRHFTDPSMPDKLVKKRIDEQCRFTDPWMPDNE